MNPNLDVSVIMPCLNEEKGVGKCLFKILQVLDTNFLQGEVIIVDNGCTDNTIDVAKSFNDPRIKIVYEPKKGYGNAYLAGFKASLGKTIVMGDADNTYDFLDIPRFLNNLNENDLVLGSRFRGRISKGAMPPLHRYIGSPLFLFIMKNFYGLSVTEPSTGFMAFKKESLNKLNLKQPGMEFASEFLIKAHKNNLRIKEIPIDYSIREGKPKLRTFRDGFRHVNFMARELLH